MSVNGEIHNAYNLYNIKNKYNVKIVSREIETNKLKTYRTQRRTYNPVENPR